MFHREKKGQDSEREVGKVLGVGKWRAPRKTTAKRVSNFPSLEPEFVHFKDPRNRFHQPM
jgi:hypothetical protein